MSRFESLSLRARLFLLTSALVTIVLVTSAFGFAFIHERIEATEVKEYLAREAACLGSGSNHGSHCRNTLRWWQQADAPAELRDIASGEMIEVEIDGHSYFATAVDVDGQPYYAMLPEKNIEEIEDALFVAFSAWVTLLTALAMLVTYRMVGRLLGPVSRLANQVASLSPGDRGVRLAPQYRGEEVERIARALDQYIERLEGFVEREQSFTSATSHELRTPLAIISGAAEILSRSLPDGGDPATPQGKAVERIRRASAEMGQFIDALLALSRQVDAGQFRAETDVSQALRRICDEMRSELVPEVRLECECDGSFAVAAPPTLVHIVISNLLRNAVRHTTAGLIHVSCLRGTLCVADPGEGMPPEVLARAFERHFSGANGGVGIGLYLVKRICDQYGWQIDIESAPGRGTKATVHFR